MLILDVRDILHGIVLFPLSGNSFYRIPYVAAIIMANNNRSTSQILHTKMLLII